MIAHRVLIGATGVVASLLLIASPVAARTATGSRHTYTEMSFAAQASDGYYLEVLGQSSGFVEITVKKTLAMGWSEVTYGFQGRVSGDHLRAGLGRLGHIALDFRPRHVKSPRPSGRSCPGRTTEHDSGSFVGSFEFHGELGYTDLSADRLPGTRYRESGRHCHRARRADASVTVGDPALLAVRSQTGTTMTSFFASYGSGPREPLWNFQALRFEHPPGVDIVRTITVETMTGAEIAAEAADPETVSLSPTLPFLGSASFVQPSGQAAQWSGTLSVEMPGAGIVPLTGATFEAELCWGIYADVNSPCVSG